MEPNYSTKLDFLFSSFKKTEISDNMTNLIYLCNNERSI